MTREEFLTDLKQRALEMVRAGGLTEAITLVAIEANRRPDMMIHHAFVVGGHMKAIVGDTKGVREWIESIQ